MKLHTLRRHFGAFARALANFRYERTPSGIYLTDHKLSIGGVFTAYANGELVARGHNTVMLAARNDVLNVYFRGAAATSSRFIAPFSNNVVPAETLTAANFNSTQTEFTNYTEATRPAWTTNGNATAQVLSNSAAPASYTFDTGGGTVYGAGLLTVATKGATTGLLVSAGMFDDPVTLNAGGVLNIRYDFEATDASD